MPRFLIPTILIGTAAAGFFVLVAPLYGGLAEKREVIGAYEEALSNSRALEAVRDELTSKYNAFPPEDIARLEKLLPDRIENIRLILEIEKIAASYGMALRDVRYESQDGAGATPSGGVIVPGSRAPSGSLYGAWELEFSTQATYDSFMSFLSELESNLRIVDIVSIQFSSSASTTNPSLQEVYKFSIKLRTYWLKN